MSVIRKLKWRIKTENEAKALALNKSFPSTVHEELVQVIDKVIASREPQNVVVEIDKLRIDLGLMSEADFGAQLSHVLEERLSKALVKEITEAVSNVSSADLMDIPPQEDVALPKSYTPEMRKRNALLYFLKQGLFPWWFREEVKTATPAQMLTESSAKEIFHLIYSGAQEVSASNWTNFTRRLLHFMTSEKQFTCLGAMVSEQPFIIYLAPETKELLKLMLDTKAEQMEMFSLGIGDWTSTVMAHLLEKYRVGFPIETTSLELLAAIALKSKVEADSISSRLQPWILKHKKSNKEKRFVDLVERFLVEYPLEFNKPQTAERGQVERKGTFSNVPSSLVASSENRGKSSLSVIQEGIYVDNCGIVLLHPFLVHFFTELDLVKEGQFVSDHASYRAAVLLDYMTYGKEEHQEWEATLNKVVCGLQPEEFLPQNIGLLEKEKQECEKLLTSVIGHWSALRNTSIEGLQMAFLQRKGKLCWKENYWLLQVEQQTVDILMGKLPWGYGVVKFPWLTHPIYVEW